MKYLFLIIPLSFLLSCQDEVSLMDNRVEHRAEDDHLSLHEGFLGAPQLLFKAEHRTDAGQRAEYNPEPVERESKDLDRFCKMARVVCAHRDTEQRLDEHLGSRNQMARCDRPGGCLWINCKGARDICTWDTEQVDSAAAPRIIRRQIPTRPSLPRANPMLEYEASEDDPVASEDESRDVVSPFWYDEERPDLASDAAPRHEEPRSRNQMARCASWDDNCLRRSGILNLMTPRPPDINNDGWRRNQDRQFDQDQRFDRETRGMINLRRYY